MQVEALRGVQLSEVKKKRFHFLEVEVLKQKSVLILVYKLNVIYMILYIFLYNCIDMFTLFENIFLVFCTVFLAIHQPRNMLIYL